MLILKQKRLTLKQSRFLSGAEVKEERKEVILPEEKEEEKIIDVKEI